MNIFDSSEYEEARRQYEAEAKERWGGTAAYGEYSQKTAGRSEPEQRAIAGEMDGIFADFARCMQEKEAPGGHRAQTLVKRLREHISENYYSCTDQILAGLGAMYVGDQRFRENIDRHGDGTAQFVSEAIAALTEKES